MSEWLDGVRYANPVQRNELEKWCDIIGYDKYKEYFNLAKLNYENKEVPFGILRECAIYDAKLSKTLFGVLRIVEFGLRSKIVDEISEDVFIEKYYPCLTKKTQVKSMSKKLKQGKISLHEFLQELVFGELRKVLEKAIGDKLIDIDKEKLGKVNKFRNSIMHHKKILSANVENLKNNINILLAYIDDDKQTEKFKNDINKLAKYNGKEVRLYVVKL